MTADFTAANPQRHEMSDAAMVAIESITNAASKGEISVSHAYVATLVLAFGDARWDRMDSFDPRSVQIPEAQWGTICEQLTKMKGSDIDRVNYALSWMNQGPSAYGPNGHAETPA